MTKTSAVYGIRRPSGASGFVLLEALVAILIFSIGVLGVVGLQAAMTKAQTASKFRADAAYLATELIGTMWSDLLNLAQYKDANCSGYVRCAAFTTKLEKVLPGGALSVSEDPLTPGYYRIQIRWSPPNEGTHLYETNTAMRS